MNIYHSVYYYYSHHTTNCYEEINRQLSVEIIRVFNEFKGKYGSPKITKILNKQSIKASQKRVSRRMKILGLRSITIKKINHSGKSKTNDTKEYPNLLEQNFFLQKDLVKNGSGILLTFIQ